MIGIYLYNKCNTLKEKWKIKAILLCFLKVIKSATTKINVKGIIIIEST